MKCIKRLALFCFLLAIISTVGAFGAVSFAAENKSEQTEVRAISLNKSSVTLGVGEGFTLRAILTPQINDYITWYTDDESIANVENGNIITLSEGNTVITAISSNGLMATCNVTVKSAPDNIRLNKAAITLGVGEKFDLDSYVNGGSAAYSRPYTSSNSSVAVVQKSGGLITAKKVGSANIKVKTYNGKTAVCKVTVKSAPKSIKLNKTAVTLGVGEKFDLDSYVNGGSAAYSRPYTSSNSSVAAVQKSGGLITAKKVGSANIKVKTYNGKTAVCKVTVKSAPKSIKLNMKYIVIRVGEKFDLDSYVNGGSAAYSRPYTSSNSSVATVQKSGGLVTGKKVGSANITVKTFNGKTAVCKVTVNPKSSPSLPNESTDTSSWNLKLVNLKSSKLSKNYVPPLGQINGYYLRTGAIKPARELMNAARRDGVNLYIVSGYRSYQLQTQLFNNRVKKYQNQGMSYSNAYKKAAMINAVPGTSEHQLGLAIDFNSLDQSFGETKEGKWLYKNAWKYGFVFRYPKESVGVTGIIYEPWHYRYVGVNNARAMHDSGMTLEAYIEYLNK